jgi:hypothetical protein
MVLHQHPTNVEIHMETITSIPWDKQQGQTILAEEESEPTRVPLVPQLVEG